MNASAVKSTPRAALYCRISEKEEGVDKTANQEAALRLLAQQSGYEVQGVYTDDDISAYRGRLERPAWTRMLTAIKDGKVDVVMAVAPDRFTRGSAAETEALSMLCAQAGAIIHTKSTGVQDPSSPMVRAMLAIQDVFNGLTVDVMRQKQQDRNDAEIAAGRPLWGNRPSGFEVDRLTIVEDEAERIRQAMDAVLEGGTLYGIAKEWNQAGLRTTDAGRKQKVTAEPGRVDVVGGLWTTNNLKQLLLRPRNAGILEYKGELLGESLPAIVDRQKWEAVVKVLTDPSRAPKRGQKSERLLSAIIECQCGGRLTMGRVQSKKRGKVYAYEVYRCRKAGLDAGQHSYVTADMVVKDFVVEDIGLGTFDVPENPNHGRILEIQEKLSKLREKSVRATEMLMEGIGAPDVLKRSLAEFTVETEALSQERAAPRRERHERGPGRVPEGRGGVDPG